MVLLRFGRRHGDERLNRHKCDQRDDEQHGYGEVGFPFSAT
jgi:hypothetical protein